MRLILVRHGQSTANEQGICHGQTNHLLSEKGKAQVKKLALRLKNEKIDIIYSSDLKRAIQTTKAITKYHPHIKIIKDKRIREFKLGDWEGKPYPLK